jgi:phage shock protein C
MDRNDIRHSLKSEESKIAGVCSTLGARFGIDPTFLRIGFVAFAVLVEWEIALVAYVAIAIFFAVKKNRAAMGDRSMSDFDRMSESARHRASVRAMREDLSVNDRRMMAVDHHLNSQNDQLAREIEALRKEDK